VAKWLTTEGARALAAAELEARLRRQAVGTPHLLLGLLADERGRPAAILDGMGFSLRQVRYEAAHKLGTLATRPSRRRPVRSTKVTEILDRALHEANAHGRRLVEPEDMLLALVADPGGKASRILERLRRTAQGDPDMVPAAF
jgi:ATP-dependent Clp protease ATP-binding subunit ClpC